MADGVFGVRGIVLPTLTDDGRMTVATRPHLNDKDWPDFWADRGDDLSAVSPARSVAMGQDMWLTGDSEGDHEIVFRFNEPVQIRGGEAWLVTPFDYRDFVSVEIFAEATPVHVSGGAQGNCNLVPVAPGLNVIVPAPSTGSHNVDLVEKVGTSQVHRASIVPARNGDGFYDYDMDSNTISPNAQQQGEYNLFDAELRLQRFLNHVRIREEMTSFIGQEAKLVLPHWSWRAILHHGADARMVEICFRLVLYRQTSY